MHRTPEDILDELLVLQAQDGEVEALQDLLNRWRDRLWKRAHVLCQRPDAADDVLQNAMLAIARGVRGLDDPAAFPAWAMRIVAFKASDWIRAQRRGRRVERPGTAGLNPPHCSEDSSGSFAAPAVASLDGLSAGYDLTLVRAAIDRLPSDRRAILLLHYAHDIPLAAIARSLGIPPGTVKSRLFHARRLLKQLLERNEQ